MTKKILNEHSLLNTLKAYSKHNRLSLRFIAEMLFIFAGNIAPGAEFKTLQEIDQEAAAEHEQNQDISSSFFDSDIVF